VFLAV